MDCTGVTEECGDILITPGVNQGKGTDQLISRPEGA